MDLSSLSFAHKKIFDQVQSLPEFNPQKGFATPFEKVEQINQQLLSVANFNKIPSVHVAGTNGKGSTSRFLAYILSTLCPSLKIGLTTSPHFNNFLERICVFKRGNPHFISPYQVATLAPIIMEQEQQTQTKLFLFPFVCFLAFLYFERQNVDFMIVETGLGGRLDSTNILYSDLQIITSIGMDHASILGDSLSLIFKEKLGILNNSKGHLISGVDSSLVQKEKDFIDQNTQLFLQLNQDFFINKGHSTNNYQYRFKQDVSLTISSPFTLAPYLQKNLSLALTAFFVLFQQKKTPLTSLPNHLTLQPSAFSQGRMQTLCKSPLIVCDSAHNREGFHAFIEAIENTFFLSNTTQKICVIGLSEDKNIHEIISICSHFFDAFIFVDNHHSRALSFEKASETLKQSKLPFEKFNLPPQMLLTHLKKQNPQKSFFICGSFFLLAHLYSQKN